MATNGKKAGRSAALDQSTRTTVSDFVIPASTNYAEVLRGAKENFYKDPNVIGVGIGPRRVHNRVRPGEYALLVYVREKLPKTRVRSEYMIPEEFMGLRTDVIEPFAEEKPGHVVDYVRENYLNHDMSNVDWARLHELDLLADGPTVAHAAQVQDFGDICVIEDDGTVVKTDQNGNPYVDFVRAYQLFRTLHGDDYDFVTFCVDPVGMPSVCGCSFWSGIYNDVGGIGLGAFNGRAAWGTARLQGFHFMNQGHFPLWRYVMLQEFGHQFAAFARYRDPVTNATMTDHLLGGVLGHWALELDDEKSPMDYDTNDWVEQPGGQFRKVNLTSDERTYSDLDLYMMGLLGPSEVGEFSVLRGVAPVSGSSTLFNATPVRLNIQNFVAQEGPRIPSASSAQKYWRQAFIVLTKDIHKVKDFTDTVDFLRIRWERDFAEATQWLGRVDTVLDARPGRLTPAQIAELTGGGRTNLHRHAVGPLEIQLTATQWTANINPGQTQNWFTYNWSPGWLVAWSVRPTTAGGKLRSEVSVERAANGTFTYWISVTNTGPVATAFEGKYALLK